MREKLAGLAHAQWSGWMTYLFSKGTFNDDGTWTMPAWAVERWKRQMTTGFDDLSEPEKESDRTEADKFLQVFNSVPHCPCAGQDIDWALLRKFLEELKRPGLEAWQGYEVEG